jgi:hypothetical protein
LGIFRDEEVGLTTMKPIFEDKNYILFKKFYGNYFDEREEYSDWSEYEKAQKEFLNNYLDSITEENIDRIIDRHINFQEQANIAESKSSNLSYKGYA